MRHPDSRDIELTAHSPQSAERYDRALQLLASYFLDPLAVIDSALADDPDFVSGHCLRAGIGVLAAERAAEPLIRESVAAGERLAAHATERERRHIAAARCWLEGDLHRAIDLYGRIVLDHPRDLLALQIAHVGDFYLGQQRMLRDRIAHVLPYWNEAVPGFGYVLGMFAFGLEETNLFETAESVGRRALDIERRDAWSVHAVAHVFEMTGQVDRGIDWLNSRLHDWAPENGLAYHNFWHLALFQLARQDFSEVLRIFDSHIWPKPSRVALEMVDAASLLFRLHLKGVDVGTRSRSVADAWSDPTLHGHYAFNDAHAVMAFITDGRLDQARAMVHELEQRAGEDGSNAAMTREVGLPLIRALIAFGEARYDETVEALLPLRLVAHHFGGSNAQRSVLDQLLVEASSRAGRHSVARAITAERSVFLTCA